MKKFYVTTAIPYVNAAPHIGHALEYVQTDVIARFQKQQGRGTYFLTGTDDNALKNVEAAEKHGASVADYVKKNADIFEAVLRELGVSNNDFIRTTEKRHIDGVQKFWQACKHDIYKKKYKGLYCVGCETFYLEKDLIDGKCPEHKTVPETIEEENYFFKLSSYQAWLEKLIESDELKITPEFRKNEVLSFIRGGLEDFSISRSVKRAKGWGIPVPGDPEQIIYVWFDALTNYITALGWQNNSELFQQCWPADVQVIGKGISRFHAIYWPVMLKSAGVAPPKELFIHGYVTANKEKISKSLGNVIDPFEEVKKYGVDAVRYYLLKEIPAYGDGDYSDSRFIEVYNSDLANNLGNVVSRVAKLSEGQTFPVSFPKKTDKEIEKAMQNFRFDEVLKIIFNRWIDSTNVDLNVTKPWTLDSSDEKRAVYLASYAQNLVTAAYYLEPFIPETSEKIKNIFSGTIKPLEKPLFPRIAETKKEGEETAKIVIGKIIEVNKTTVQEIILVKVDVGGKILTIACADLTLKSDLLVSVALPGAKVYSPKGGWNKIRASKVHGIPSEAMLCSALELGFGDDHSKIYVLKEGKVGDLVELKQKQTKVGR